MNRDIIKRVDKKFIENVNKLYPQEIGFVKKTRRLNDVIEELLYGKKKI